MEQQTPEEFLGPEKSAIESKSHKGFIWADFTGIIPLLHACFEKISTARRKKQIKKLLAATEWFEHYKDKANGRRVLSESSFIEYRHELKTAVLLARFNYDVIFAPKAMFLREQKKFDIFLIKDTVILKADLKCITSQNSTSISKRIKEGSDQASRVVIHINSNIARKDLIIGLRQGVNRNNLIKEILLVYNKKLYRLPKSLIVSDNIHKVLK